MPPFLVGGSACGSITFMPAGAGATFGLLAPDAAAAGAAAAAVVGAAAAGAVAAGAPLAAGAVVAAGVFGAEMRVKLTNDGPVTLILEV